MPRHTMLLLEDREQRCAASALENCSKAREQGQTLAPFVCQPITGAILVLEDQEGSGAAAVDASAGCR